MVATFALKKGLKSKDASQQSWMALDELEQRKRTVHTELKVDIK